MQNENEIKLHSPKLTDKDIQDNELQNEIKNSIAITRIKKKTIMNQKFFGKDATVQQIKTQLEDFEVVSVLGKGAFGKVYLVQKKDTKEVYAMKSLRKDTIIDLQQLECTLFEKKIL